MEKSEKMKKVIVRLTVVSVLMDFLIGLLDPAYTLSSGSLIAIGFMSHSLVKEYEKHKSKKVKVSKGIVFLSVSVILLSIYRLVQTYMFQV
ncbi:hypothetical protein J3A84_07750 [Proteiniclasticum sp. SCR006]|uniref:Uncharacterized protein n=1 Tax=Proteiniclasticum aestuarii TaxID=2817862 RepID=A0A939H9B9_9CLOT|nr:hypothetical protein [Proteiniclasticum aestuarii]MBO1264919.1 hypothetical protein [Proteiniclasticum aestuarii]